MPIDHGDAGDGAVGQPGRGERAVQQLGERGLGEHADDEGGDGDAELGAGELEGQLPQGLDDACGPAGRPRRRPARRRAAPP